ncbi:MAG TPA: FGGY-family carbohydrate kinase [Acidimicrobiales bacterium]|nr:FGGY-family carbohydrate kinase [Acidimicrobiales bacterium]
MTSVSGSVTVGIDIGTTSTKAVAVDAEGTVLARSRVGHRVITPAPDLLEHDAGRAWRKGPLRALAEVSTTIGSSEIAGVCVAGMVPSLAAVTRRGFPCSPGLLYGDLRGRDSGDAAGAEAVGDAPVATARDASAAEPIVASDSHMPDAEGFVRWAVRECPGAHGYWPAQAVANYALGRVPAVDSAVSMSLGALMSGGTWDSAVLESIGVSEKQMPVLVLMGEAAGTVTGTNAVLAGGTVDALCDQIVSGAEEPGDVLVICGATLVVWAVVTDWIESPGLWTVPHTTAGRVLVGGPSNAGAFFVDWARALLDRTALRQNAARAKGARGAQGAGGEQRTGDPWRVPVWTPYLRGERAPFHDPLLRSGLHGLDVTHDAASLERAAHEASGFVVRQMLDRAGISAKRIVASGGGTRSRPWMQAMADATGLPVDVVAVHEGAALGAAYMARMAAGIADGLEGASRWARVGERIEPDRRWQEAAAERYRRFRSLGPET